MSVNNKLLDKTFDLLKDGEKKIKLSENKNSMLVLGNIGSGKSAFTQFIIGDNSKLISKEVNKGSGEFTIIDDGLRISNSSLNSKTLFPEFFENAKLNSVIYDMPGFGDNINISKDMAKTYFIKKVADYSENLKFIFVINYFSVRKGADQNDFLKLVKHSIGFIKNIDKFKDGITMVISKVDNQYIKDGNNFKLVSDSTIKKSVAQFLEEIRKSLEEKSKISITTKLDKKFCESAIKFIDALLVKDGENYKKIGLFRRPDKAGPISEIDLLQNEKKELENLVYVNSNFIKKDKTKFDYTLSENSKNEINNLLNNINDNLSFLTNEISNEAEKYYQDLFNYIKNKLKKFTDNKLKDIEVEQIEAKDLTNKIDSGYLIFSNLTQELNDIKTIKELSNKIESNFIKLGIKLSTEILPNIKKQEKYLDFIKLISNKELKISTSKFTASLQKLISFIINSKNEIKVKDNEMIEKVRTEIEYEIEKIIVNMKNSYHFRLEKKDLSFQQLLKETNDFYNFVLAVKLDDSNLINLNDFVEKLKFLSQYSDTKILRNSLNISNLGNLWEFLKILNNDYSTEINNSLFIKLWTKIFYQTKNFKQWIDFVSSVNERLSEYDIQKDTNKCIGNLGIKDNLTLENFDNFLKNLKQYGLNDDKLIENIKPNKFEIKLLDDSLNFLLKNKVNSSCESDRLLIKGDFIKFNDLNKTDNCQKDLIQIFSTRKLFIDYDLIKVGNKLKVTIVSPLVEIINDRTINLNGKPGLPGSPGGASGSLMLIGKDFINNYGNLFITANGGDGSKGEDGKEGEKGRTPNNDVHYYYDHYDCDSFCNGNVFDGSDNFKCSNDPTCRFSVKKDGRCYNIEPKAGADGKDGGKGGNGGLKGSVIFSFKNGNSKIKIVNNNGLPGENGKGGLSGLDGDTVRMTCKKGQTFYTVISYNHFFRSGKNGTDGGNSDGIRPADPAPIIDNSMIAYTLMNYKEFLRGNLDNKFNKNNLIEFYEYLESNAKIENYYSTLSLVNELKSFEQQFTNLKKLKITDLKYLYESFARRVYTHAKNLDKNDKTSIEHRKVLSYLYAAILTKIHNLESDLESDFIIDVDGYLDLVSEDINSLKDLQKEDIKQKIIEKTKNEYQNRIDNRIGEAKKLIEKEILPQLDNITKQMNKKIDDLIKEVLELEKKAEEDKVALIKKKHELEKEMALHGLFSFLKILGAGLSLFGGFGAIAGSVIGAGTSIGESLALGNQRDMPPLNIKPDDIKRLNDIIDRIKNKKIDEMNGLLDHLEKDLEDYKKDHNNSTELNDLAEILKNIREKLKKPLSTEEVKKLQAILKEALEKKEKELKEKKILDIKIGDALKTVKEMYDKFNGIKNLGLEIYNQYKNDRSRLGAINNAIKETESTIEKLRGYEDEIYKTISPMLEHMQSDLKKIAKSLEDKSQVTLDINQYKTQSALRDMKLQIHQLTQGFKVEANLERLIEKQEETMNTLINVYDRIENYKDQQNLGNYIANICSAAAKQINITDKELANGINQLEIAIRSNIVLKQYSTTINALKQWVFPFASIYLDEIKQPDQFKLENTLENQIDLVKAEIEKIKRKVKMYKTSVISSDQYIHNSEFSSKYKSTTPFYVLKNVNNNETISKLLSGEEVLIKADIENSPPGKNGIKFNLIEFNFKIENDTLQNEINEKLKLFGISATHLGNSYYKCEQKIYSIVSPSQTIEYSLEKKEDGSPVDQNNVYKKIKSGDLMLSPYALWKLKLRNVNRDKNSFNELLKYKNLVDLELVGYGGYLQEGINISELKIDDYYKFDNTIIPKENNNLNQESFISKLKNTAIKLLSSIFFRSNVDHSRENKEIEKGIEIRNNLVDLKSNDFVENNSLRLISNTNEKNDILNLSSNSIDTIGNLLLGNLVLGKMYGPNKNLNGNYYQSPNLQRKIKINELTRRILPALEDAKISEFEPVE